MNDDAHTNNDTHASDHARTNDAARAKHGPRTSDHRTPGARPPTADNKSTRVPVQFRLPDEVREFLRDEAAERHTTQTRVVIEALGLLRRQRLEALMAEGYRETAETDLALAEEFWPADQETWPAW